MRLFLLPLIVPALLLFSACSSTITSVGHQAPASTRPAGWIEKRATVWGELPSYSMKGQSFKDVLPSGDHTLNGAVTLDILVSADGTVEETAVYATSGNPDLDRAAQARFTEARYTLRLGPDDPAPHVVRLTVAFKSDSTSGREPIPKGYQDYKGAGPQPQY